MRTSLPETHKRAMTVVVKTANQIPGPVLNRVGPSVAYLGAAEAVDQTFLKMEPAHFE